MGGRHSIDLQGLFLLLSLIPWTFEAELNPPKFNLAEGKKVTASATCGIDANGDPLKEQYCHLAGASLYNPHSSRLFIYETADKFSALSIGYDEEEHSFIQVNLWLILLGLR